MKLAPAYTSKNCPTLGWRLRPFIHTEFRRVRVGPLYHSQCIVARILTKEHWGQLGVLTMSGARIHFDHWPNDMRMPVNCTYTDEA